VTNLAKLQVLQAKQAELEAQLESEQVGRTACCGARAAAAAAAAAAPHV